MFDSWRSRTGNSVNSSEKWRQKLPQQVSFLSICQSQITGEFYVSGDDHMLEAVEATFKQFSTFLDLLHDKG